MTDLGLKQQCLAGNVGQFRQSRTSTYVGWTFPLNARVQCYFV